MVATSLRVLQGEYGRLIDGYDIVVSINRCYQRGTTEYANSIGSNTHILSIGVKSEMAANQIVAGNAVDYILSPIIWSDKLSYQHVCNVEKRG